MDCMCLLIGYNMVHCNQVLWIMPNKEGSTNPGDPLISLIAEDQFKDSVLKYDRYQLKNISFWDE